MKGKIQGIVGLLIIGFLVVGLVRSIYNRNFAEPEFKVLNVKPITSSVQNVLFWYEEDLEKIEPGIGQFLSLDGSNFTQFLYNDLKTSGMVSEQIKTMSKRATQKMIELDAYRGTEPNVLEIAEQKNIPYIFKIIISDAIWKERTNDLQSVTYHFSLYKVTEKTVIWEAETTRLVGFFGGMPDNKKTVSSVRKYLKEAKIIK